MASQANRKLGECFLMRVCMLHNNYYRSSGSAIAIRRIVDALSSSPVEFVFAGCAHAQPGGEEPTENLDGMGDGRYRQFSLMSTSPKLFLEMRRFAKWLVETRCDIVHSHHRRLAAIAQLLSPLTGIPVIYTCHNVFPEQFWFRVLCPRNTSAVSRSCYEYLKRSTRDTRIYLIPNPYPFEEIAPRPFRELVQVVSVGRLEPVKGHRHLIDAWKIVRERGLDAELRIFGEGYLRPELEERIRAHGLEGSVSLLGFSPDVAAQFRESSFNVLVSETEGFPNAVIEAAACGLPSLLTDVEGSRDTIPPEHSLPNGLEFGNVPQLADVLCEWISHPLAVSDDGLRFRDALRMQCSPSVVGAKYFKLYAAVLER